MSLKCPFICQTISFVLFDLDSFLHCSRAVVPLHVILLRLICVHSFVISILKSLLLLNCTCKLSQLSNAHTFLAYNRVIRKINFLARNMSFYALKNIMHINPVYTLCTYPEPCIIAPASGIVPTFRYQGPLDSRTRTRTSTRFECPFLAKILRIFITWTIHFTLVGIGCSVILIAGI